MSGKKSCEVAAVLKQGEKVRKMTDDIFSKEIADCYARYRSVLDEVTNMKNEAEDATIELDEEAKKMFGADGKKLIADFARVKKFFGEQFVADEGKAVMSELSQLDQKLSAADAQAQSIRDAIRNKDWYCDAEYAQARELLRTYEGLRSERVNLERRMKKILADAEQRLSSMRAESSRLKNLAEQATNMNATAKKRKQADSFRKELQSALTAIDTANAEKFFKSEFTALKQSTSQVVARGDEGVLTSFQKQYSAIADFKARLTERVALWQKQKDDAQAAFERMERAAAQNFPDPIDSYNGEANGRRINLFDYLKIFGGKDLGGEYFRQREEAVRLIRQERFLDSMTIMSTAIDLADSARQEALTVQENMLKKLELAGAIQDVMDGLRYNTDLQIINDNPNDGFKITCNIGDETIDFERVDIDAEGKVVVNVDHTEGKGSNCSGAWNEISKRLNVAGIPLTEVRMANGAGVLHGGRVVSNSSKGVEQRGI